MNGGEIPFYFNFLIGLLKVHKFEGILNHILETTFINLMDILILLLIQMH